MNAAASSGLVEASFFWQAPSPPQESNPFHFEDSQVVLQVEEKKYKIHRYFLTRESEFFNDLFSLPQPEDSATVEGSDDNPIRLPETPKAEIENLLRFFYFGMHDDYAASLTDWIAILSISTRLMFEKVRERAIKEITAQLDQIEPFELIELAIKFDVEQWLKPAYRRIVTRATLITHAEAAKVPFPMAVMLMRSREQFWKNFNQSAYRGSAYTAAISPDPIIDAEIRLMVLEPAEATRRRSTARSTATASAATATSGEFYGRADRA